MIFIKINIYLAGLLLLFSCSSPSYGDEIVFPEDYHSSVSGLFLDAANVSDRPDVSFCEISMTIKDQELLEIFTSIWRKKGQQDFLITAIQSKPKKITVASPMLCDVNQIEQVKEQLLNEFNVVEFDSIRKFQIQDTVAILRQYNVFNIDLDFKEIDLKCSIIRETTFNNQLDIGLDDITEIRYLLAIPILYYNTAGNKELLVFDSGCENKELFLKIIDKFHRNK